jgi:hypothetical protein
MCFQAASAFPLFFALATRVSLNFCQVFREISVFLFDADFFLSKSLPSAVASKFH